MKKIFYSVFTKIIAWLLIISLTVIGSAIVYDSLKAFFGENDIVIYDFGANLSSSDYISSSLSGPISAVLYSYEELDGFSHKGRGRINRTEVYSSGSSTSRVEIAHPTATPKLDNSDDVREDNVSTQKNRLYEYIENNLHTFVSSEGIKYYIEIDDKVFTNCDALSCDKLQQNRFFYQAERMPDGSENYTVGGSDKKYYEIGCFSEAIDIYGEDTIRICAAIDDSYAKEIEEIWIKQEKIVSDCFARLLYILGAILLLLIYLTASAGQRADGEKTISSIDKIWTEIYLGLLVFFLFGSLALLYQIVTHLPFAKFTVQQSLPEYIGGPLLYTVVALSSAICLGVYLLCIRKIKLGRFINDSIISKAIHLSYTIIRWAINLLLSTIKKLWGYICNFCGTVRAALGEKTGIYLVTGTALFSFLLWLSGVLTTEMPVFLFVFLGACAFLIYKIIKRAGDVEEIKKGVQIIRAGDLSHSIPEPASEDLKRLTKDLNEIAVGLEKSLAAKLRAEKMKTELITNISHDLKTPLTSIINYTELLSKLEGLPQEAKDYVGIILSKSMNLKTLTLDLFDISRVQSGNEQITFERIDTGELIEQSLAEHEKDISASELNFVSNINKGQYIFADGKKLSRVLSNLLTNVFKYSLPGTRVFLSNINAGDKIIIEIKNIASYPMDFNADEIVGRFVRGDVSRSEEGNGLGLAIAKSYVEACHGKFDVIIDGDLFKVRIEFDKVLN